MLVAADGELRGRARSQSFRLLRHKTERSARPPPREPEPHAARDLEAALREEVERPAGDHAPRLLGPRATDAKALPGDDLGRDARSYCFNQAWKSASLHGSDSSGRCDFMHSLIRPPPGGT